MACGIIAVASSAGSLSKPLGEIIRESLKSLEYRGYDSVGFAVITKDGELVVRKSRGMIDSVSAKLGFSLIDGLVGIGHTRWATHGAPSDINSHPHLDCKGRIAVAHNGIIENWQTIKKDLINKGHVFVSDTDTEVIPHLIEEFKRKGLKPYDAFKAAVSELRGAYALVSLDLDEPDKVFFARHTSPLVVGLGKGVNFLASDIPAFLRYTRRVVVVRDGEVGFITSSQVVMERRKNDNGEVTWVRIDLRPRVRSVEWTPEMAMKEGFPHFMLKEIHEQPRALSSTLAGVKESLHYVAEELRRASRVVIIGAGTSYHASYLGALLLNNVGGLPSQALISSEMRWYARSISEGDVVIAVSQSGETIDTLLAVRAARRNGAKVIALSNVVDSAIPREASIAIYTRAGPEIGVAATKTFTTQVLTLSLLSVEVGKLRNVLNGEEANNHFKVLSRVPELAANIINSSEAKAKAVARKMAEKKHAFYLGRGFGLPISMEGALKLKEVAYVHAEAYPAGESKHGPIALVEDGFPVLFTATTLEEAELVKSNVEEMKARYAWTLSVTPRKASELIKSVDIPFIMPDLPFTASSVLYVLPYQLIAYYTAVAKGYDPDKPRNLAKTVTVV